MCEKRNINSTTIIAVNIIIIIIMACLSDAECFEWLQKWKETCSRCLEKSARHDMIPMVLVGFFFDVMCFSDKIERKKW